MKQRGLGITILLTFLLVCNGHARQSDFPHLKGPYLGQKPPGMTPEVFAPGIVSSKEFVDFKGSFSPDGDEYYFYRLSDPSDELIPTIFFTKVENGVWTKPAPLQISQGTRASHPCVSSDNQWLFFLWQFGQGGTRQSGIYASRRTDAGWSVPKYVGRGMYLTSDRSGQLYTTESAWGSQPKHYLAKVTFSNGVFSDYERLHIDPHYENQTHPCIAPDGSYLIFDINVENGSLYVSFKDKNGDWGEAIDLTQHGFEPDIRGAYVSPDGKYLFFSYKGDIWWVDIQVIEKLRQKESITLQTYHRWRKEYGGMRVDQAKRLKELEQENIRLKKLAADLSLDNAILKEVDRGNF
jgi:Tol biopolymer transport system component